MTEDVAPVLPRTAVTATRGTLRRVLGDPGGVAGFVLMMGVLTIALLADLLAPGDPFAQVAAPLQPPSTAHPFGTDDLGRDLLTAVVHGLRTSLLVGASVAGLAGAIGIVVGATSGYSGPTLDDLMMRGTEVVQVIPRFFLAIVVVALFGPGLDNLVLLLGLTSWTWTARVVRAEVLTLRGREFVESARSMGASTVRILVRHVIPNALPPTVVMISIGASTAILIEAGLGFVGLSDPSVVSLGYLAGNAQRFLRTAWWMTVFPGAAIVAAVLGINLLGDTLNDLLNPHRVA